MTKTNSSDVKKLDREDLMGVLRKFWRQDIVWNLERQQSLGSAYMMSRVVGKLYMDDPEKCARALQGHVEFMATIPHPLASLYETLTAMEEEDANNPDSDETSISAARASLMGPIAGISDSLIWGTLRIIATGITISFSTNGSTPGPLLFPLIVNIPTIPLRYICLFKGYKLGTNFFKQFSNSGITDNATYIASVVGLMVIGCMTTSLVSFQLPIMVGSGELAWSLQIYLDQIMPGLPPLIMFGIMYFLLGKKIKTTAILLSVFALSIVLVLFGIAQAAFHKIKTKL